ncbi:MAG: hypothetical protein ABIT47_00840 [Candidatus Paceibacterota bacterium]
MGKYRIPAALFGWFIIIVNLSIAFVPGLSNFLVHVTIETSLVWRLLFSAYVIAGLVALTGVMLPFSDAKPLQSFATASSIGWPLAWICVAPYDGTATWSLTAVMFFAAWSFTAAVCMARNLPPFKFRFEWPVRLGLA